MPDTPYAPRLSRLPVSTVLGIEVRVARGLLARLLGLARLDCGEAGPGLLIPRCSSVHTFGMRFRIDLYFLDGRGEIVSVRRALPPRRFAFCRQASAVLELPVREGGEIFLPGP